MLDAGASLGDPVLQAILLDDEDALRGLLSYLWDMNLTVLSVDAASN